ncbi:MAG: hypothetical protein HW402_1117 [Dehalococcoidales bacterium]|nr:hypothetical protein [Dehalococcoidales bacterium]
MKVDRRAILVIGIGVFLVVFYLLYRGYSAKTKEREELSASLSGTQPALARLISQREALANQMSQLDKQSANITSALNKAKASYPGLIGSIEYDEILFRLASAVGVELTSLSTSEPSEEKVKNNSYWATNFSLSVKGKPGDVFAFIDRLVSDAEFATASISSVSLSLGETEATISLPLVVYGRKE